MCIRDSSRADALREIHFPQSESTQKQAVYRLKFEEFYQFKKELAENYAAEEPNACPMKKSSLLNNVVIKGLPYTLTNAQQDVYKRQTCCMGPIHHRMFICCSTI